MNIDETPARVFLNSKPDDSNDEIITEFNIVDEETSSSKTTSTPNTHFTDAILPATNSAATTP